MECLMYIALFLMLTSAAMVSFYFCWDGSKMLISATDDVSAALRAGERWRADVRSASGSISVEMTSSGEVVEIPEEGTQIVYRFDSGAVQRQVGNEKFPQVVLPRVKSSEMESEARGSVTAWRWELELAPHRKDIHLPLLFTFEAAQKGP